MLRECINCDFIQLADSNNDCRIRAKCSKTSAF